jgi:hypothetical protein
MPHHHHQQDAACLFDWVHTPSDHAKRAALADMIRLVQDVLALPTPQGHPNDFQLSAAGARGLSLILGAVEQSLRFDINAIGATQQEDQP